MADAAAPVPSAPPDHRDDRFPLAPPDHRISRVQARVTRVLMGMIMFLTGTYVGIDWAEFFHGFTSTWPARAGYARTILCAILVAMTGSAAFANRDIRFLQAAFVLTLIADYCLILHDWALPGTAIFAVVHALLIWRHAQGFLASLAAERRGHTLLVIGLQGVVVYGAALVLIIGVRNILKRTGMFAVDAGYLLVLATSLWMGVGKLARSFYPSRNAWYVAVGMVCFAFCDVSVGLSAALTGTTAGAILNNIVGFFYSPALVLLAYSGYAWRGADAARPAEPVLA
jgi:hypothetical protein